MKHTGKYRFRTNWFGKQILQVQVIYDKSYDCGGSGYYDEVTVVEWRDATRDDSDIFLEGLSHD